MATIYRPRDRRSYYFEFTDPATGERVRRRGFPDRRATEVLAADAERDAARGAVGFVRRGPNGKTPADYERHLLDAGSCVAWAKTCRQRIEKIRKGGVEVLRDVSPDTRRRYKQLLESWSSFSGERVPSLPDYSTRASKFQRRALTADELGRLLDRSPPSRSLVYRVAAYTGLRRSELRRLTWANVTSDRVTVYGKAGRVESVPLHRSLPSLLEPKRQPTGFVFPTVPHIETVHLDYKAAEILPVEGKVADFHSLRYTFCTMLARAGVNVWDAMQLMRHRDIKLTTRIYLDASQLDTRAAVDKIP